MSTKNPETTLDQRYSSPDVDPTPWTDAQAALKQAGIYWLSTVRPDGRPHVTPLIAVWDDDALYFCTGVDERKRLNLGENSHCVLTTGCNLYAEGMDIVIEGEAARVTGGSSLQAIAGAFEAKYGSDWHFEVNGGGFVGQGAGEVLVYRVAPVTAFGFGRGEQASQTRWRF